MYERLQEKTTFHQQQSLDGEIMNDKIIFKFLSVIAAFCLCNNKTPERNQLEEGKVYFGSWCQRFQSMVAWPHCFWVRHIMAGACAKSFISLLGCEKERKRPGFQYLLQGHASNNLTSSP
jgi:hypothetical protein